VTAPGRHAALDADVWTAAAQIQRAVDAHARRSIPLRVGEMRALVEALADVLTTARSLFDAVALDGQSWAALAPEDPLALAWTGTPPDGWIIPLVMNRAGVTADLGDRVRADLDNLVDDLDVAADQSRRAAAFLAVLAHRHDVPAEDQGSEGW
jgi:hypothetical protein